MSEQSTERFDKDLDVEEEELEQDDYLVWSDPGVLSDVELPDTEQDDEPDKDDPELPEEGRGI